MSDEPKLPSMPSQEVQHLTGQEFVERRTETLPVNETSASEDLYNAADKTLKVASYKAGEFVDTVKHTELGKKAIEMETYLESTIHDVAKNTIHKYDSAKEQALKAAEELRQSEEFKKASKYVKEIGSVVQEKGKMSELIMSVNR
jgi:hypothetical protein